FGMLPVHSLHLLGARVEADKPYKLMQRKWLALACHAKILPAGADHQRLLHKRTLRHDRSASMPARHGGSCMSASRRRIVIVQKLAHHIRTLAPEPLKLRIQ